MALIIRSVKTCTLGLLCPLSPSVPAEAGSLVLSCWLGTNALDSGESLWEVILVWLVILLFLIDVNDVCYYVHNVLWFWFKHTGNFGVITAWLLLPWHQCTSYVRSNFKPLCRKVTCASDVLYMQLTLVCWYVACMLPCHCWMFSLSVMLCQGKVIPLKYGSFVWPCLCATQFICFLPIYFSMVVYHGWHLEDVDFIVAECSF